MLRELQESFLQALHASDEKHAFMQKINASELLTPEQHFAIYRDSIRAGFIHALADTYPVCQRLVGKQFFSAMAGEYIRRNPSYTTNLDEYGETFSEFIASFPPAERLAYLADVARLEWAYLQVYNGSDFFPDDIGFLRSLPESKLEKLRFQLPANAVLLESEFPVNRIWQVNQPGYLGNPVVHLFEGGVHMLIWRPELQVQIDTLTLAEWSLLNAFKDGASLNVVDYLFANTTKSVDIAVILAKFIRRGYLQAVKQSDINFFLRQK